MPDVLIYGDTLRSPELRHEVAVPIPDPFLYAERDGRRVVAIHSLEVPRVRGDGPRRPLLGRARLGGAARGGRAARRALPPHRRTRLPLDRDRRAPSVPPRLPGRARRPPPGGGHRADRRPRGLHGAAARQVRTPSSTGIRRAQRAAEAAMDAARELLRPRRRERRGLVLDGEPLTVRADQAGDRRRLHGARHAARRDDRLARRPERRRPRDGLRARSRPASRSSSISGRRTARPGATPT